MKKNLLLCLLFGGMLQTVSADDIHLPTMGWSSWNCFGLDVSYTKIQGQALALTKKGLDTVGYKYINIDDGFMKGRDPKSDTVIINKQKFPYGIRSVADYIRSLHKVITINGRSPFNPAYRINDIPPAMAAEG